MPHPQVLAENGLSYAVLSSLPVCRVEEDQFVPSYVLFFMIYFAEDRDAIIHRYRNRVDEILEWDPEYYDGLLSSYPAKVDAFDLKPWVDNKQLKWLDIMQPNLPLQDADGAEFPYFDLPGRRKPFEFVNGEIRNYGI